MNFYVKSSTIYLILTAWLDGLFAIIRIVYFRSKFDKRSDFYWQFKGLLQEKWAPTSCSVQQTKRMYVFQSASRHYMEAGTGSRICRWLKSTALSAPLERNTVISSHIA